MCCTDASWDSRTTQTALNRSGFRKNDYVSFYCELRTSCLHCTSKRLRRPDLTSHSICLLPLFQSLLFHFLAWAWPLFHISLNSQTLGAKINPFFYKILICFTAPFPADVCLHSSAFKQEAPQCFVAVGSSAAIPTQISVTWISDAGKPTSGAFIWDPLNWLLLYHRTSLTQEERDAISPYQWGNLTHIYLIPPVDCLQRQQWITSWRHTCR